MKFDPPKMMSKEDALALKVQCQLSDVQYQLIRNASLRQNADIFPPLTSIMSAKSSCYPPDQDIQETSARVPLQSMLDHTLSRILEISLGNLSEVNTNCNGILYVKGGMDGASSQSIYHQRFEETNLEDGKNNEQSLFQTAIVPLKLVLDEKEIWINETHSSSHFCRPLHLQYKRESKEVLVGEKNRVQDEIVQLVEFQRENVIPNGTSVCEVFSRLHNAGRKGCECIM